MQAKIIGIGKCGSRISYDIFAYVRKMPSSYKIRVEPPPRAGLRKIAQAAASRLSDVRLRLRIFLNDQFGESLIAQMPSFVTIDSDIQNNEIFNWITFLVDTSNTGSTEIRFPGRPYRLSDRVTGCDHHIISENVCHAWRPENGILTIEGADIFLIAFSIGGGTGGGAGPLLLGRASCLADTANHFMALGVLPKSDQLLLKDDIAPAAAEHEKYSTGRFFTGFFGGRDYGLNGAKPRSIWMLSNDLLRTANPRRSDDRSSNNDIDDPNIAIVNRYIAASFTNLANSSSPAVISDSNLDAQELNNRLNRAAFFSAWNFLEPDPANDTPAWAVARLLEGALTNGTIDADSELQGLSIPIHEAELESLKNWLRRAASNGFDEFLQSFPATEQPVEFRSAREVVLIYGQPEDHRAPRKAELLEQAVAAIFKNSHHSFYHFRQTSRFDTLLIFIVDPFVRVVQHSIYYYLSRAWLKDPGDPTTALDNLLGASRFDSAKLLRLLRKEEHLDEIDVGEATLREFASFPNPVKVTQENVVKALAGLHRKLNWKKRTVGRSRLGQPAAAGST